MLFLNRESLKATAHSDYIECSEVVTRPSSFKQELDKLLCNPPPIAQLVRTEEMAPDESAAAEATQATAAPAFVLVRRPKKCEFASEPHEETRLSRMSLLVANTKRVNEQVRSELAGKQTKLGCVRTQWEDPYTCSSTADAFVVSFFPTFFPS
jgi:hypothetical protein